MSEKNVNQPINQLFNEGQVDLVQVDQFQILPRLVLQSGWREYQSINHSIKDMPTCMR